MNHSNQVDDAEHALAQKRRERNLKEDAPICAACRSKVGVRADSQLPGVLFCEECWRRAHDTDSITDVGAGD